MNAVLETLQKALEGRYSVAGQVGQGGMATVFLAQEIRPSRPVAIKVFDPNVSKGLGRERFLREVDVSGRLSHPHIVPIFAAGEAEEYLYYLMPYLEGESLRQRLISQGGLPLPIEEALHLTRDVADALQYAHGQRIIHRDIKPENILISEGHAVVADFGIARAISAAEDRTLTQGSVTVGTPGYMSPEQAMGRRDLDGRTDIYSLGCVLYEMVVGEPPEPLTSAASGGGVRISNPPAEHRRRLDRIPRRVEQVLARALASTPADRYATAGELMAGIDATGLLATGPRPARPSLKRRAKWVALVASVILPVGIVLGYALRAHEGLALENRVVVAPFDNQTGDPGLEALGRMAADWITQGLTQANVAEVVSFVSASAALAPRTQGEAAGIAAGLALARETGAATVVWGSYFRNGNMLQFQAQISDARSGSVRTAIEPVSSPLDSPLVAVDQVRQRVISALAIRRNPVTGYAARTPFTPPRYDAYREFIEGMAHFNRGDHGSAARRFVRAVELDSTFAGAYLWGSISLINLGMYASADSLAMRVDRFRDRLSPFDRAFHDYVDAQLEGDLLAALQAVRQGSRMAPGSEATYAAGEVAVHLNRPREALEHFAELDPETGWLRMWPFYWFAASSAYALMGEWQQALDVARRGRRLHPEAGFITYVEARALAHLGKVEELTPLVAELLAGRLDEVPGGWDVAQAAVFALRYVRRLEDARALAGRMLAALDAEPEQRKGSEISRFRRAMTLGLLDRREEAQAVVERLVRERPDSVSYLGLSGALAAAVGDRALAARRFEALGRSTRPFLFGNHLLWQARIAATLGENDRAVSLVREAMARGFPFMPETVADPALARLRGYGPWEQLIQPKG
jgi:tetratricopeptide (TPR) repeat protein